MAAIHVGRAPGWARLARLRIIAEIPSLLPPGKDPEDSDERQQRRIIDAFASTGARMIISLGEPFDAPIPGWQALGDTGIYTFPLSPRAPP